MCRIGGQGRGRLDTRRVPVGVGWGDRGGGGLMKEGYLYV